MNIKSLISEGVIDLDGYMQVEACKCPSCGAPVNYRFFDSCNGGCVNQQKATECPSCGYHSCDDECCTVCEERYRKENSDAIATYYGISSPSLAALFLAKIETDLMVLLAKLEIELPDEFACDDIPQSIIEDVHNCADLIINFDKTDFVKHPLSREIRSSVYHLLGELNELIFWSDSF